MRGIATAVLAGVGVLGLAACGGGDDRLGKQAFLDQANATFCRHAAFAQEENAKVFGDGSATPTDQQILAFVDVIDKDARRTFDAIADLRGPKNLDDAVDDLTEDSKAALGTFRTRIKQSPQAIDEIEEEVFGRLRERASKLGIDPESNCG